MSDFMILILILVLLICLVVTVVGFVLYSGLLAEVVVRTGSPPVRNLIIAYKFREGPYRDSGAGYTESCSIGPLLSCIGIFYDDPKQVRAELRLLDNMVLRDSVKRAVPWVSLKH